jgi:hypothetical protein
MHVSLLGSNTGMCVWLASIHSTGVCGLGRYEGSITACEHNLSCELWETKITTSSPAHMYRGHDPHCHLCYNANLRYSITPASSHIQIREGRLGRWDVVTIQSTVWTELWNPSSKCSDGTRTCCLASRSRNIKGLYHHMTELRFVALVAQSPLSHRRIRTRRQYTVIGKRERV